MGLIQIGLSVVIRIHLTQDRHKRQAVVNMVMNV
jgi:hypothetical protein